MVHIADKTRVAFDTNIWISFTIGKRFETLKSVLLSDRLRIYICPQIIKEYLLVVHRTEVFKYITLKRISDTIELMETFAANQDAFLRLRNTIFEEGPRMGSGARKNIPQPTLKG